MISFFHNVDPRHLCSFISIFSVTAHGNSPLKSLESEISASALAFLRLHFNHWTVFEWLAESTGHNYYDNVRWHLKMQVLNLPVSLWPWRIIIFGSNKQVGVDFFKYQGWIPAFPTALVLVNILSCLSNFSSSDSRSASPDGNIPSTLWCQDNKS